MRTEDLRYFLAVAATGKLGPASDLAGISQPGLTKAIARLEAELGGALFMRTGRGMQLTELGQAFEKRASRVTAELNDAVIEARTLHPLEGLLRIGVAPSIQPLLVPACARLMAHRPLLRLELMSQINDQLEIAVGSSRIDLAVVSRYREFPEDLQFIPVGQDVELIVVSSRHPLALAGAPLHMRDLMDFEWALPRRDMSTRRHLDEAFASNGLPLPTPRLELEFSASGMELIAECGLLTFCTPYMLRMMPEGMFTVLQVKDLQSLREIGVLTRRGIAVSPLAHDLIGLLGDGATAAAAAPQTSHPQ